MEEELISVVVPIYKVEKFLPTCIESLIKQSYKNMELILVDDGSPDLCPQICDKYKQLDSRIKVIHKTNGGLSDARNAGIEIAQGEWITFVDSDDYVGDDFLKTLYIMARKSNADISICDYESVLDDGAEERKYTYVVEYNNVECLKKTYIPEVHGMEFTAWGKLYRIGLFRDLGIRYPVGKIHEDTFTTYKLLYEANRIVFFDAIEYFYRRREESIMTSAFNKKRLVTLDATREACRFFERKKESELLELAINMHLRNYVCIYNDLYKNRNNINNYTAVKRNVLKNYREDFQYYIKKSNFKVRKKIFYTMFYILPADFYIKLL